MGANGAWWKVAMWGWVVVVLVGCSQETHRVDEFILRTIVPPTDNAIPRVRPTLTRESTWTPSPPNLTPIPTLKPKPTLPPGEAIEWFLASLLDNGGCRLPCFLGEFEPGVTRQEGVEAFISQYGNYPYGDYSDGQYYARGRNTFLRYGLSSLLISSEYDNYIIVFFNDFIFRDGVLSLVDIYSHATSLLEENKGGQVIGVDGYLDLLSYFTVSSILQEYGKPTEILVFTYENPPWLQYDFLDISLVMHYKEIGLVVEYGVLQQNLGETMVGCFQDLIHVNTYISEPSLDYELYDYMDEGLNQSFIQDNFPYYLQIEDAIGMSLEEFFVFYKEPGEDKCFETPTHIWP